MLFHNAPTTSFTTGTDTKCGSTNMFCSLRNIRGRMKITKGSYGVEYWHLCSLTPVSVFCRPCDLKRAILVI